MWLYNDIKLYIYMYIIYEYYYSNCGHMLRCYLGEFYEQYYVQLQREKVNLQYTKTSSKHGFQKSYMSLNLIQLDVNSKLHTYPKCRKLAIHSIW